jgi:hypothetical protein
MTTIFPCQQCDGVGSYPKFTRQLCDVCGGTGTEVPDDADNRQKVHHKKKLYKPDERPHKKRLQADRD